MKKLFTLSLLLVLALSVNAQETYRKSWDFTKWSATTIANLKAEAAKTTVTVGADGKISDIANGEANWRDSEKKGADNYSKTQNNCFWQITHGKLDANGSVIEELAGLTFTNTNDAGLAIAVNYPNALNDYNGPCYLWLGSKNINYFVIPHVAPGTTIKMGVESHKNSANRGVQLYVGKGNTGTLLKGPDGNAVATPKTYEDQEWLLPAEGLTDTPNEDGTFDITVRNTDGCHVYYITVGDGDAPAVEEAKNVAFLGTDEDFALGMFDASVVNATVVATVPTLDELQENYDALVIGTTATEEQLQGVKDILAFFPIVNSNPALYATLGLGSAAEAANPTLTFTDASLTEDETLEAAAVSALTLGEYFANDVVLAKAGDDVAIHVHNAGRNPYYFIPTDGETEGLYTILSNAIVAASKKKAAVAAVGTPNITFTQADGKSTVTITATNSKAIYYTVDGSAPTAESTMYTEPFDVTENVTVKAFATGDGYTDSQVGEKEILIATQLAKPQIQVAREAGKSTITLTAEEGAAIYFNFNGAKTAALSQKYTEPIELTEPAFIYVLATKENYLPSELGKEFVGIDGVNGQNIRMDIYAHMDANQTDWFVDNSANGGTGSASAYYYWGNKAWNYYSTEVDRTEIQYEEDGNTPLKSKVPGQEDQDSVIVYYKVNPEALKTVSPTTENGWILKSEGQVLTGELQLAPGDGVGNGATGRYAEEAIDFLPAGLDNNITKGCITFGAKTSGEPYTARIESTYKFAGPFDVVVFCGNGNNSSKGVLEIQTSADGTTWTKLAELNLANTQRYVKRTKASYDAAEEVFVRVAQTGGGTKAQVYDIYILNSGEKSAAYSEEATGIKNVKKAIKAAAGIYDVNGVRRLALGRGLNIVIDEQGRAKKVVK